MNKRKRQIISAARDLFIEKDSLIHLLTTSLVQLKFQREHFIIIFLLKMNA